MSDVVVASFSVWSRKLVPSEIANILLAVAERETMKGTDRVPPRNLPDAHGWHIVQESRGATHAENCLTSLLDRVVAFQSRLTLLRAADPNCSLKITIQISRARLDQSISLSEDMLSLLASLGASVFVSVVDLTEI